MSVEWKGDAVLAKVHAAAMRGVVRQTQAVHEEATHLILDTPKSGRTYRRRGVEHQASAPGQPFASDTGATVQSGRTAFDGANLSGTVSWSTKQAASLEFGNENMEARSYARPALANRKDAIEEDIQREIRDALK
ncbi:hypothetical protein [Mesorhizobium sp. M0058]|uniref:hypothetical protein n=1 Tax=Mesorhizobium sp. M0058 TaxID=2956865 RepID=UPI00333A406D